MPFFSPTIVKLTAGSHNIARRQKHAPRLVDRSCSDKRGMINNVIKLKLQCCCFVVVVFFTCILTSYM